MENIIGIGVMIYIFGFFITLVVCFESEVEGGFYIAIIWPLAVIKRSYQTLKDL